MDIEDETSELVAMKRSGSDDSADILCWRIGQMLPEIAIGPMTRNDRIMSVLQKVETAICFLSDSKNKKNLEIVIRNKKEEIKKSESQRENLALPNF
jgi:hypothetical protein